MKGIIGKNGEDHVHGNGCRYAQREKYPAVMRLSAPINIMPIASFISFYLNFHRIFIT
jgi:hypothetical protein